MNPATFPEQNLVLVKPPDMTDEECVSLPTHRTAEAFISCWVPTDAERAAIAAGDPIWLHVIGGVHPPVILSAECPFVREAPRPDRCSLDGAPRISNSDGTFGACSLVSNSRDGKGGCKDPLHDLRREEAERGETPARTPAHSLLLARIPPNADRGATVESPVYVCDGGHVRTLREHTTGLRCGLGPPGPLRLGCDLTMHSAPADLLVTCDHCPDHPHPLNDDGRACKRPRVAKPTPTPAPE